MIFGMETGSPKLLRRIDKKIQLRKLEKVMEWADEAGIWVGLETICGFPHETWEDIEMTADFIKRNKRHINTCYYNILSLKPGSRYYLNPSEYGICNIVPAKYWRHPARDLLERIRYGYDEIGGLKWEDKVKQMIERYEYLVDKVGMGKTPAQYEMEHLLFFLYSKFRDKKDIERTYRKIADMQTGG